MKLNYYHHRTLNHTIICELVDANDTTTAVACRALSEYWATIANQPELAASSYYVIVAIASTRRAVWVPRANHQFEAFGLVTYSEVLRNGDTGEVVVVGPCGFDQCICDGNAHAMRWGIAAYCRDRDEDEDGRY
jgi:hypothetical protein